MSSLFNEHLHPRDRRGKWSRKGPHPSLPVAGSMTKVMNPTSPGMSNLHAKVLGYKGDQVKLQFPDGSVRERHVGHLRDAQGKRHELPLSLSPHARDAHVREQLKKGKTLAQIKAEMPKDKPSPRELRRKGIDPATGGALAGGSVPSGRPPNSGSMGSKKSPATGKPDYRTSVRTTFRSMSDQALEFQSGQVKGGIDREELDREASRRRFHGGKRGDPLEKQTMSTFALKKERGRLLGRQSEPGAKAKLQAIEKRLQKDPKVGTITKQQIAGKMSPSTGHYTDTAFENVRPEGIVHHLLQPLSTKPSPEGKDSWEQRLKLAQRDLASAEKNAKYAQDSAVQSARRGDMLAFSQKAREDATAAKQRHETLKGVVAELQKRTGGTKQAQPSGSTAYLQMKATADALGLPWDDAQMRKQFGLQSSSPGAAAPSGTGVAQSGEKGVPMHRIPVGSTVVGPGGKHRKVGTPITVGDHPTADVRARYHDGVQWDYVDPGTKFDVVHVPEGKKPHKLFAPFNKPGGESKPKEAPKPWSGKPGETAQLLKSPPTPTPDEAVTPSRQPISTGYNEYSVGRGPKGNVRNVKSMGDAKFAAEFAKVMNEHPADTEVISVFKAEAKKRGMAIREGKLTTKQRDKLPRSSFAIPPDRYPIHDEAHARNALSRVAQHGTPAEKARVKAAVARRYPNIGKKAA